MNKLAIAITLVSALVGLVAISSVGANPQKKLHHKHEGGEVHKPHHGHHGHKGHKTHVHKHEGGEVHKPQQGAHVGPGPKCNCPKFNCHAQRQPGGFGQSQSGENQRQQGGFGSSQGGENQRQQGGFGSSQGGESQRQQGGFGSNQSGESQRQGGFGSSQSGENQRQQGGFGSNQGGENQQNENEEGSRGTFEGAGFGFGFRKDREFDAGVRGEDRERERNQFQKHQGFSSGESDRFNSGESSSDVNTVEGVHKRKNINNNKVVVAETNRGNEDVDGFRLQSGHSQENHSASGDNKFVNADGDEFSSQDHDNEREVEAGVHKKEETEGFGGLGVVRGQF